MSKTDFAKFFKVFKNRKVYIFHKSNYIFEIFRSRASKPYKICSYFTSLKFFLKSLRSNFVKISHKVAKSKYFSNI